VSRSLDDFISDKNKSNPDLRRELSELGNYTELATKIQRLRSTAGMSQRELAEKIGTSQANIVRWETPGYSSYTVRSL
jgi:DNA-binding XRE family transcriptional regulator